MTPPNSTAATTDILGESHWMPQSCPHCGSLRLTQRQLARRVLGLSGTLAGAAGTDLRAWRGAEVGGTLGAAAGPPGMALRAVAGLVLGALVGGS